MTEVIRAIAPVEQAISQGARTAALYDATSQWATEQGGDVVYSHADEQEKGVAISLPEANRVVGLSLDAEGNFSFGAVPAGKYAENLLNRPPQEVFREMVGNADEARGSVSERDGRLMGDLLPNGTDLDAYMFRLNWLQEGMDSEEVMREMSRLIRAELMGAYRRIVDETSDEV